MITATEKSLGLLRAMMVATILLPVIGFLFASWNVYRSEHQNADTRIAQTLDILQEHALKVFESAELTLALVAQLVRNSSDEEVRKNEAEFHHQFLEISKTVSAISAIWLFNNRGEALVASNLFPLPAGSNYADREYFKAHIASDVGSYIGVIIPPRLTTNPPSRPFFPMSRRRHSEDRSFKGVIQLSIIPEAWEQFYARLSQEGGYYLAMLLPSGAYLASYPFAAAPNVHAPESVSFPHAPNLTELQDAILADGARSLRNGRSRWRAIYITAYPSPRPCL